MTDFLTSQYLREQLEHLDHADAADAEDSESLSPEDRDLLRKLQALLVETYEALSTRESERVHDLFSAHRSLCEYFLDDHFSRHQINAVPAIVRRVMRFEPLSVSKLPTGPANVYLREAFRCHVFGLHQGAMALARSAIEQGLRERVPTAGTDHWTLDELIDAAGKFKLLDRMQLQMATDVQHVGNRVLHQQPCSANESAEALTKARLVLEALFG